MSSAPLRLDEHGAASLDGRWEFFPAMAAGAGPADLHAAVPEDILVPGLWESQGHLGLDGVAWYRRRFTLADVDGWWSLRFGAVMDVSEVWLNGARLGDHDNPFTPFTLDPTAALVEGENVLVVRVYDPPFDSDDHLRLAHGKQGWANHVFPSRPSLYMTYGGIWQPVVLRRHGPVVVRDVFVDGDPDDVTVRVRLAHRGDRRVTVRLGVRAVGRVHEEELVLGGTATTEVTVALGPSDAARWSPADPVLHRAHVDVVAGGDVSDAAVVRFGLRTVRVDGRTLLLNGEPYRMKSALVQGFRADSLYAEGDRAAITAEVLAAKAMGFNTLRLHIKAFDPAYLDVCDELGMLLHCDIPVAEPIAHEELGAEGESAIATRSVQAVRQQVERDRNHPSVILWSVMNELCLDRLEARAWDGYERFARALVAAAKDVDHTRPVIENDWVEPDPERVFAADVLTAHWYGRLHADYLDKIERACALWRDLGRPLYVTEFGDWGLPDMPALRDAPFWDTRGVYQSGLAGSQWPASVARFVIETQRYQGLSDRLQAEVFRRHDHIGGYCLTELTDVPHELNGLLDLHRRPKPIAVDELTRANQVVLPMLRLDSLVVEAAEVVAATLHVANDGPPLEDVTVEVRFGDTGPPIGIDQLLELDTSGLPHDAVMARFTDAVWGTRVDRVDGYRASELGRVEVQAPHVPGSHDLVVRLTARGTQVAENRYPVHVVARPSAAGVAVRLLGATDGTADALEGVGATVGATGLAVVAEGGLDGRAGAEVADRLGRGEVVVVLAQAAERTPPYPVPVTLHAVETEWGSSVFHFTSDHGALPSLPRRNVLVAEDSTVQARSVVTRIGDGTFPDTPVVIAYKPVPGAITGTVVGSHRVGAGRLVFCQYRLCERARKGDAAGRALLADLVRWAAVPRRLLATEASRLPDGRNVARYSHVTGRAR